MSKQQKTFTLKRRWSALSDISPGTPEKKLKSLPVKFTPTAIAARKHSYDRQERLLRHKSEAKKVQSIKKSTDVAVTSVRKGGEPKFLENAGQCNEKSVQFPQKKEITKGKSVEKSSRLVASSHQKSDGPKFISNELYNDVANPSTKSRLLQRKILVAKRALESIKRSFFQRFEQGELLGVGSFGKVYAGIRKKDQLPVAIKYIPKRHARNIEVGPNRCMPAEVYFQHQLDHPNIIKLLENHYFDGNHVLVTERPPQCTDLFEYLTIHSNNSVDETEGKTIFRQLLNAVEYLEGRGILHNDLKPENVLLDLSDDGKVKLIDFGLAWKLTDEPIKIFSGTPEFCPPEYHINHQYDGRQSTVWSLGCFLFDMLTGKPPFVNALEAACVPLNIPEFLSQDARDFLGIMLETRPWMRASLSSLKDHSWLKASCKEKCVL